VSHESNLRRKARGAALEKFISKLLHGESDDLAPEVCTDLFFFIKLECVLSRPPS
jgi:hypothetical protein